MSRLLIVNVFAAASDGLCSSQLTGHGEIRPGELSRAAQPGGSLGFNHHPARWSKQLEIVVECG